MATAAIYPDIVSIKKLDEQNQLFKKLNKEYDKENIIRAVRAVALNDIYGLTKGIRKPHAAEILNAWDVHDYKTRLMTTIDNLDDNLQLIADTLKKWKREGKTYGSRFILTADAGVTVIDFTSIDNQSGIPDGVIINVPGKKVCRLRIKNEGGGRIVYSTNHYENTNTTTVTINPGDPEEVLEYNEPTIGVLSIRATLANTIVNIKAEI